MDILSIRREFPIVESRIFLNHAGTSPFPRPVLRAMQIYMEEFSSLGRSPAAKDDAKSLFAKLIRVKPEEVALIPNTSTGLNIAANVLEYPRGANIVTTDLEFPSVVYPWLRRKMQVEVRYVKNVRCSIPLEDIERAIDDNTVAVAISHVEYTNGFRHDLESISKIAHEHGAFLIVDAVQSAGALRIDAKSDDVDFLAASCYKWLLGPSGIGFLYVRGELMERLEPTFVGWASVKPEVFETTDLWNNRELKLSETASRFEIGGPSTISLIGAAAALKMILDVGIINIERRILDLTGYLIEEVKNLRLELQTPEEPNCRSGIVNFIVANLEENVKELRERGIIVSARANGIRVSPHFYNTKEEIATLVENIKK